MAIDKEVILIKLAQLEEYIGQIERMEFGIDELLESKDIQHLISFRLQQAVETAIYIANHLVAGLALPQQETAVDVMGLLAREEIISEQLAIEMGDAARFRNLVVHQYGDIDFEKVYSSYNDDLDDLRWFAEEVQEFVEEQEE